MAITYSVFWRKYSNCFKIFLFHLRTSGNFFYQKLPMDTSVLIFWCFLCYFSFGFLGFSRFSIYFYLIHTVNVVNSLQLQVRKYNFFMLFVFYSFDFLWFYGSKTYIFNPIFKEDHYVVSHCKYTVKKKIVSIFIQFEN